MAKNLKIGQQIYTIDYAQTLEDLEPVIITDITKERVAWNQGCISIGIDYVYISKKEAAEALIERLRHDIAKARDDIARAEWDLKVWSANLKVSRDQYFKEFKKDI